MFRTTRFLELRLGLTKTILRGRVLTMPGHFMTHVLMITSKSNGPCMDHIVSMGPRFDRHKVMFGPTYLGKDHVLTNIGIIIWPCVENIVTKRQH